MSARITRLSQSVGARAPRTFQDVVTFKRPTQTVDSVGGTTQTLSTNSPASVPCKYEPYRGAQKQVGGKIVSNADYVIKVPAYYSSALVDVDSTCQAIIAARSGGEPARTFSVDWVARKEGFEIEVYVSLES